MRSKKNIFLFMIAMYFYYLFIKNIYPSGVVVDSNDILSGVIFDEVKFGYRLSHYIIGISPFLIFMNYPYVLHIKNSDKNFIEFHRYRASSSKEIFLINLKHCIRFIIITGIITISLMYLIALKFKLDIVFNLETALWWIRIISIVSVQHIFLNLNLNYKLLEGIVAIILINTIIITLSVLSIEIIYLMIILLLMIIITLNYGRRIKH